MLRLHVSHKILVAFVCTILTFSLLAVAVYANSNEDEIEQKRQKIEELQQKLEEVKGQQQSLSRTIGVLDTRVQLTESQISETETEIVRLEQEIEALGGKIYTLDESLNTLTTLLVNRLEASYKNSFEKPMYMLLSSEGFSNFFRRYKYLKASHAHDREVMFSLEQARKTFDDQKILKQDKQKEVEDLQSKLKEQEQVLESQRLQKSAALEITKNDERRYQSQLQTALSELEAIQSIIAGKGNETSVGEVSQGDRIASVIPGASTCSNGPHLHFEVAKSGAHLNPASYLKSRDVLWDNSPDGPFGFSGGWEWPVEGGVRITQGYGMTFYAATLRYYGGAPHTGIDMMSTGGSLNVSAVKDGTLFRGAIACGGGNLRYVRVKHNEGDYSSYYLHVNY